jgi:hypothetical protein
MTTFRRRFARDIAFVAISVSLLPLDAVNERIINIDIIEKCIRTCIVMTMKMTREGKVGREDTKGGKYV